MSRDAVVTEEQFDVWEEYTARMQNLHNAFVDGVVDADERAKLEDTLHMKYDTLFDLASL